MRSALTSLDRAIEFMVFACFLAIVLVGTAQVFNRYVFNYSLSWSEEFQRYGQVWLVFLGIPVAYRRGMHIGMEMLAGVLSPGGLRVLSFIVDLLWAFLAVSLVVSVSQLMQFLHFQRSPGMQLPMPVAYGGILLGSIYMALISVRRMIDNVRGVPIEPPTNEDLASETTP